MRALQISIRSSLHLLASALHTVQCGAASRALQLQTKEQCAGAKNICIAADPLLFDSVRWNTGDLRAPSLIHPKAFHQSHSRRLHLQPATRPAAAMASERQRQPRVEGPPANAAGHGEESGLNKTTLWQQLRVAGRRAVKRSSDEDGQHMAAKSARQTAAQAPNQRPKHSSGSATQRQTQLGRKGVTDLGQGAQIHYSPGMFGGAEAAQLLRALQVGEHWTCLIRIRTYGHSGCLPAIL